MTLSFSPEEASARCRRKEASIRELDTGDKENWLSSWAAPDQLSRLGRCAS